LLHKLKLPHGPETFVNKETKVSEHADNDWLIKAQDIMLDFQTQKIGSQIAGKLHSLCHKASTKDSGEIDLYDRNAISFARAFKDALDIKKHGGKIGLPEHLHNQLPESLTKNDRFSLQSYS